MLTFPGKHLFFCVYFSLKKAQLDVLLADAGFKGQMNQNFGFFVFQFNVLIKG